MTALAAVVLALAAAGTVGTAAAGDAPPPSPTVEVPRPASGLLPDGRRLTPAGTAVELGNYPTGAAVSADGRLLWTVSAGFAANDVRIVDTRTGTVCATLPLPGASGGIALDSRHHRAYVSGLRYSRWIPQQAQLPGAGGNAVIVYRWDTGCGDVRLDRVITVAPQPNAPPQQAFPPPRQGLTATSTSWPQKLAVSPDGRQLLVPLNLADSAAIVDLTAGDRIRYAMTGAYPFGAAVAPDGATGLVTNEAAGTVSVVDLARGTKVADITVGPPLSHPQGVVVDRTGRRAYVALSASDQVVVVDLRTRTVERSVWVGRTAGLGTMPVSLALSPRQDRLFVAESGADELAVVALPAPTTARADRWRVIGRIPTADQPQAVVTVAARGDRPARLMYVAAEGMGIGANPRGPVPTSPSDPIFWAFDPVAPTFDVFAGVQYTARMVRGRAGLMRLPSDARIEALTPAADEQLRPTNAQDPPRGTPLRADGPIEHVFFIVRENRSYDQVLGDDPRGNGDPKLTLFGPEVTPNLHALVRRFPLLDNVYANSEASIQGHYWTAAASVPDYVSRNWVAQYAARGRPNDFGTFAVSWPGNGFLFNQAERQGITYFNFGEGFIGGYTAVPDRDRTPAIARRIAQVEKHSDLGPPFGGCYPSDMTIGLAADGGEIFDSSLPSGAPPGSYSHVDCFRQRFARQVARNDVPALTYLTLTSDHTRGTEAGFPTPDAMVADSDLAVGQIIDTVSHSPIWSSSAIFVVEDDSQDGADHVNAHRIPVLVASPYVAPGAVVHTRYDLLSVVRSIELILGMRPLTLNDALATPMYDVFTRRPRSPEPVTARPARVDLLRRNTSASPDAQRSRRLTLERPDAVSQADLDAILWHFVHGAGSTPPPPGPGAEGEDGREDEP